MIKLVIFDLDGTLVNAYPAVASSVNYTLKHFGATARSYNQIKRSVGGGDRKLLTHFLGEKLAEKAIAVYRPHHAQALKTKGAVKLLPGVLGILKFLKSHGFRLAVASNRPTKYTLIILRVLKVLKFFDAVLCADKAGRPKPYPDMLWMIARRLGCERQEGLFLGDMTIDVKCARRAGMCVVAVATGSSSKKALKELKPWAVIDKMIMLKPIIKKLSKGKNEQKIA